MSNGIKSSAQTLDIYDELTELNTVDLPNINNKHSEFNLSKPIC